MKNGYLKFFLGSLALILIIFGSIACKDSMQTPYEKFIENGEIIYPEPPDSVKVYPGKNRIKLAWPIPSDPNVSKARVYWNNGQDSLSISYDRSKEDTVNVMLTEMREGTYTFTLHSYDDEGNASVKKNALGKVYGDLYKNSLINRFVNEALYANNVLEISWGNIDNTNIGSEISYKEMSGSLQKRFVPSDSNSTVISDYDPTSNVGLEYRSLFLPDSMAIDTFYTSFEPIDVIRREFGNEEWSATASSYDERHGTDRAPGSVIDDNPTTIWVNKISPQTYYPHSIIVDMGSIVKDINGLSFIVQNRNETPKQVEISISNDNSNWITLGKYSLANTSSVQDIGFSEKHNMRYFKVEALEPHGDTPNIVIGEIGINKR